MVNKKCLLFVKTDRICMILHKWVEKKEWFPDNLWLMASYSWTTLNNAHNMVQGKPLSLQLHLLELHGGSLLQPHLIFPKCSLGQAFEWSGKRVGLRDVFSSFFQPKFSRFIFKVLGSTLTSRHIIAWKCALFTFSMNASLVGGRADKSS